jgi:hypothetical protein
MLFLIAIHGGLLIMMGQHARSESLFYYFRIEDQVSPAGRTPSRQGRKRRQCRLIFYFLEGKHET